MVVGIKDGLKLTGIIIVSFCAVFICTLFLNFYLDAKLLKDTFTDPSVAILYEAQMATSKITCAISGGFLAVIAAVMLVFYIKLYIDSHSVQLGILKAMGYSDGKIALRFFVFGISVLVGASLGFGFGFTIMPLVYENMAIEGLPQIKISFHPHFFFVLVIVPTVVFSALSCGYAYLTLHRPVSEMLRGKFSETVKVSKKKEEKERPFISEMCLRTLFGRRSLAFFVAFSCFCFSSMTQMSVSMLDLSSAVMGALILSIGIILSATTIFMSVTSLVNENSKSIAIMKTLGYSAKECYFAVLAGYHVFALMGFAVGTLYQYVLLKFMVGIVYRDVLIVPEYSFNIPCFFIVLAIFIVLYEAVMLFYAYKINKISVKEIMTEI